MQTQPKRTAKQRPLRRIFNMLRHVWLRSLLNKLDRDIERGVRTQTIQGLLLVHWLVYANTLRRKLKEITT